MIVIMITIIIIIIKIIIVIIVIVIIIICILYPEKRNLDVNWIWANQKWGNQDPKTKEWNGMVGKV